MYVCAGGWCIWWLTAFHVTWAAVYVHITHVWCGRPPSIASYIPTVHIYVCTCIPTHTYIRTYVCCVSLTVVPRLSTSRVALWMCVTACRGLLASPYCWAVFMLVRFCSTGIPRDSCQVQGVWHCELVCVCVCVCGVYWLILSSLNPPPPPHILPLPAPHNLPARTHKGVS